jgi:hypothetical protein
MAGKSGPMARKITNSSGAKAEHPYANFERDPLWKTLNRAVAALVKNQDIHELTKREYIVGYLCKTINESKR